MEYHFTLLCELPEKDCDLAGVMDQLAKASCTDALAPLGKPGHLALKFIRKAGSAESAMLGAIADLKRAFPEAKFDSAQLLGQLLLLHL